MKYSNEKNKENITKLLINAIFGFALVVSKSFLFTLRWRLTYVVMRNSGNILRFFKKRLFSLRKQVILSENSEKKFSRSFTSILFQIFTNLEGLDATPAFAIFDFNLKSLILWKSRKKKNGDSFRNFREKNRLRMATWPSNAEKKIDSSAFYVDVGKIEVWKCYELSKISVRKWVCFFFIENERRIRSWDQ